MGRNSDAVKVGDIYTNLELDLTYRVVNLREEDGETVATVETLEEGVETYRTVDELVAMLDTGEVVEARVSADAFDYTKEDDAVPVESADDRDYLKIGVAVVAALALAGVFVPLAGVLLKFAARFLIPIGIAVLAVYLLYRALS